MTRDGQYHLVRLLGAGGMGEVFEARYRTATGFERRVALKCMHLEVSQEPAFQRMFADEAMLGSQLHHANIVQVLDYGTLDGRSFLALEFVDGVDASRAAGMADDGLLPFAVGLHIAHQVAHALAYLHTARAEDGASLGIVHRDVSPQNVLLSWEGDVKLTDLGIAVSRRRDEVTEAGVIKGKRAYLSPEQREGREATPKSDVFALGVTLHRLWTGRLPEPDGSAALCGQGRALLEGALRSDPQRRPSAAEFASMAALLLAEQPEPDGRAALVTFLEAVRPQLSMSRAMDDLLGLVVAPVDGESAARAYTSVSRASVASTETDLSRSLGGRSGRAVGALAVGALAVGVLAVGTLGVFSLAGGQSIAAPRPSSLSVPHSTATHSASTRSEGPSARRFDSPSAESPSADSPSAESPSAESPSAESPSAESPRAESVDDRRSPRIETAPRRVRRESPPAHPPPRHPTPAPPGALKVAGPRLFGADVWVDGRRLPQTVPTSSIPVAAGPHTVVVREPGSGRLLLERRVQVVAGRELRVSSSGESGGP